MKLHPQVSAIQRQTPATYPLRRRELESDSVNANYMCPTPPYWWCTAPTSQGDILVCCAPEFRSCSCDLTTWASCQCNP